MQDLSDLDPLSSKASANNNGSINTANDVPLTSEEASAYASLFRIADVDGNGNISAQNAVAFLTKSRLAQNVLGEIWIQADKEQNGFLNQQSFYRCLKLIALAQAGKPVSLQFLGTATPLPVFEGVSIQTAPAPPKPLVPQYTGASQKPISMSQQPSSSGYQLSNEERDRFVAAFNSCSPQNGFVSGSSSKDLFVKSGLSLEILSRIWTLVDTQNAMQLNLAQFMLAMLIITQMKSGALQSVPTAIPPSLLAGIASAAQSALGVNSQGAATASPSSTQIPGSVSNGPSASSSASIISTTAQPLVQSPVRLGSIGAPPPAGVAPPPAFDKRRSTIARTSTAIGVNTPSSVGEVGGPWAITPEDKTLSDSHFENLDAGKKGYVSGQDSYGFFLKSQLDQTVLAQIWDLANVSKSVGLSKDEFAVAMYLIKLAMTGVALPETLPTNLVPPAFRTGITSPMPIPQTAIPVPQQQQPTQSAQQDLMGLGDIAFEKPAAPLPPAIPQPNPAFDIRRFSTLVGGNSLSKGLSGSIPSLTDDRSADIANARAQLAELQKNRDVLLPAQEELRAKRAANEIELQKVLLKRQELTLELTQASATYEAETAIHMENLAQLQQQQQMLQMAQAEVDQAKQIVAAKLDEKNQVIAAIEAVKAEIADCQRHLAEMDAMTKQYQEEISVLRPKFAEVHADLKKQMNLVEINKQLWTSVTEEHRQLKADFSREEQQLEEEKRKLTALSNQVAVQTAINDKERAKAQAAAASLSEARSLSNSHTQSLSNLNAEVARGFDIPQQTAVSLKAAEKSPTPAAARPKPPPPPTSRNVFGSMDRLEKRKSLTPSLSSLEALTAAPAPVSEPVAVVSGPPPPMPPMFTKPKTGGSLGDLLLEATPAPATSSSVGGDFAFDADFESAFNAVPLVPSGNNKASAFDDAFSFPPVAATSSKAFDDAFALPPTATPGGAVADAFSIPASTAIVLPPPTSTESSFILPPPPHAAPSMSDEGFDRFKRPSNATASLADTSSIKSGRKRINKLKAIDADSEFENAFGGSPVVAAAAATPDIPFPSTSIAAAPVAAKVDDSVFDAIPSSGDFDFDAAFAAPKAPDAFATLDDAFTGVAAAPAVTAVATEPPTDAQKSVFDAFDAFDFPASASSAAVAAATTNNVDSLEETFGTSPTKVAGELKSVGGGGLFDADFGAAFTVAAPPAPVVAVEAVVPETVVEAVTERVTEVVVAKPENTRVVGDEAVAPAPVAAKPEDDVTDEVKELMGMGFSKEQCIAALEKNEFNVSKATNFLLDDASADQK
ncbi:UNVERIFIED_CONTAM: hypothetical protein HDU68_007472 [Siphonaria sp. JEL0065]|nr:hypothetical protein HDU68_007472 [Siphonaria sp. JEL0065]